MFVLEHLIYQNAMAITVAHHDSFKTIALFMYFYETKGSDWKCTCN